MLGAAVEFLYPPACAFCGSEELEPTTRAGRQPLLCSRCEEALAPAIPFSCGRCGAPVGPHLEASSGCVHCRGERFAFERVIRLGVYQGPLRAACLKAKRPSSESVATALGELLWQHQEVELAAVQPARIVAVPHHWTTRLRRGHNPAETVATVLSRRLRVPLDRHRLAKVRRTPPQTALTATERRRNLRGAFGERGWTLLSGERILLVDDILTTGSTAHEAAKVLRKAGAASVYVAVVARSVGRV